jgi:hypothetical protein
MDWDFPRKIHNKGEGGASTDASKQHVRFAGLLWLKVLFAGLL